MNCLLTPSSPDELARQPVEKFGKRGPGALRAEIVLGFHNSFAEVLLPDAVHGDASGQRIPRIDNPLGEIEPRRRASRRLGKDSGHTGLYGSALAGEFPAQMHVCLART